MYVQAYSGSDTVGTGEKNSPVATLNKALDIVASKKAQGYTATANIIVGEGSYTVSETIEVAEKSVPEGGLNIVGAYGKKPTFVGGVSYVLSDAVKVDNPEILNRLHSDNAKANLYVLDLTTKVELSDIPALNFPGSYEINNELKNLGLENPPEKTSEIALDGKLLTVARYPNSGYTYLGTVTDTGVTASYFDKATTDETYVAPTLENVTHGFTAEYSYDNLAKWETADQAMMFGYWKHDWATQTLPLKSVNTADGTITAKYASVYTPTSGARFYIYNLLEEIDTEGEYFIDRKTGELYFYMPTSATKNSTITMSMIDTAMLMTRAYSMPVTIEGLHFTTARGTGIAISATHNAVVRNCEVSNTANFGISVYSHDVTVENCYVHDTNGGIAVGSDNSAVDTETLTSTNNVITNNEITRFSRIDKTYTPAVILYAVGNTVSHNKIHDSEGMAIGYSGQNHIIAYNEIYNVCKEVEDAGAIYVGRTWISRGNKILSNYFHDIEPNIDTSTGGRSPVAGIFLDDHYAGAYIEGNVFENIYGDGIRGNGGREHTINNNLFINCSLSGTRMTDSSEARDISTHMNSLEKSNYQNDVWKTAFPGLYNILNNNPSLSEDHIYTNNLHVGCTKGYEYGAYSKQNAIAFSNNYETSTDPGFVDMANKDYTLKSDSVVFTKIPDFVQIDMNKMGIQK